MVAMETPSMPVVDATSLIEYAKQVGLVPAGTVVKDVHRSKLERFMTEVMKLGMGENVSRKAAHQEQVRETTLSVVGDGQHHADQEAMDAWLDAEEAKDDEYYARVGLDGVRLSGPEVVVTSDSHERRYSVAPDLVGDCFRRMCAQLGVDVASSVKSVDQLGSQQIAKLSSASQVYVGCVVYSRDDPRNHTVAVHKVGKSGTLHFQPLDDALVKEQVNYVLTNPQEFFNAGGRFYTTKFYSSVSEGMPLDPIAPDMSDFDHQAAFGSDTVGVATGLTSGQGKDRVISAGSYGRQPVAPPRSVVDEDERAGSNNTTSGVVRAKRRVVRGVTNFEDGYRPRRNYQVAGVTMFNNVEELYLNVISKDYVQEIIEELFRQWALPTEEPEAMRYAEDLLCAFLIARTASNKADYNTEFEIPVKSGEVTVSFKVFSALLMDKYGITRRNFARGMADELRGYLSRPENQVVKSRSAQRVGADPQYGDLCFDGSTGCTVLTSSETTFCRILEARNLYERDDLIAEGASEKLMQGIHGAVRSVVQR